MEPVVVFRPSAVPISIRALNESGFAVHTENGVELW